MPDSKKNPGPAPEGENDESANEGVGWMDEAGGRKESDVPAEKWVEKSPTKPLMNLSAESRASQVFKDPGYIESTKSGELAPRALSGPEWQQKPGDSVDAAAEEYRADEPAPTPKKKVQGVRATDKAPLFQTGSHEALTAAQAEPEPPSPEEREALADLDAIVESSDPSRQIEVLPGQIPVRASQTEPDFSSTRAIPKITYPLVTNELLMKGLLVWKAGQEKPAEHGNKKGWEQYFQHALRLSKNIEDRLTEDERAAPLKVFLFGLGKEKGRDVLYAAQSGYKTVGLPEGSLKLAAFIPIDVPFEEMYELVEKDEQLLAEVARLMVNRTNHIPAEKVYHYLTDAVAEPTAIVNPKQILDQIVEERTIGPTIILGGNSPDGSMERTNVNESSMSGSGSAGTSVDKLVGRLEGYEISVTDFENILMETDRMFGNYKLGGVLGKGGQGIVYKATDETTGQLYALKILLKTGDMDREVKRTADPLVNEEKIEYTSGVGYARNFYREARVLAGLSSKDDHITRISPLVHLKHNAMVTKTVRIIADKKFKEEYPSKEEKEVTIPALPMEFQEGGSLAGKIKSRETPEITKEWRDYSVNLIMTLAETLGVVHSKGIVHKDLKPDNILIKVRNGREFPVLTDFGLAKEIGDTESAELPVGDDATEFSNIAGTPAYAAPEQVLGLKATKQADVYGLGATLYELLTNRRPHGHEGSLREIALKFEHSTPSQFHCERVEPNGVISADLAAIVNKCLEVELSRRYKSMDELNNDLRNWQVGKPVEAMKEKYSLSQRARFAAKAIWEKRAVKVATLAVSAGLAAGLGIAGLTARAAAKAERDSRIEEARHAFELDESRAKMLYSQLSPTSDAATITNAAKAYEHAAQSALALDKEQGLVNDPSAKAHRELLSAQADQLATRSNQAEIAADRRSRYTSLDQQIVEARTHFPITTLSSVANIDEAIVSYTQVSKTAQENIDKYPGFAEALEVKRAADNAVAELRSKRSTVDQMEKDAAKAEESRSSAIASENSGTLALNQFDYDKAILQFGLAASQSTFDLQEKIRREQLRDTAIRNERAAMTERNRQITADTNAYVARINDLFMKKSLRQYVDETGRFGNDDAGFEKRIDYEREQLRKLLVDPTEHLYARLEELCDDDKRVSDYNTELKNQLHSALALQHVRITDPATNTVTEEYDTRRRVSTYDPAFIQKIAAVDEGTATMIQEYRRKEYWTVIRLSDATVDALLTDVRGLEGEARNRAERFASRPDLVADRERSAREGEFNRRVQALEQQRTERRITREQYNDARNQLRDAYFSNRPFPK